jgi:hypothetical protein
VCRNGGKRTRVIGRKKAPRPKERESLPHKRLSLIRNLVTHVADVRVRYKMSAWPKPLYLWAFSQRYPAVRYKMTW